MWLRKRPAREAGVPGEGGCETRTFRIRPTPPSKEWNAAHLGLIVGPCLSEVTHVAKYFANILNDRIRMLVL